MRHSVHLLINQVNSKSMHDQTIWNSDTINTADVAISDVAPISLSTLVACASIWKQSIFKPRFF